MNRFCDISKRSDLLHLLNRIQPYLRHIPDVTHTEIEELRAMLAPNSDLGDKERLDWLLMDVQIDGCPGTNDIHELVCELYPGEPENDAEYDKRYLSACRVAIDKAIEGEKV